MARGPSTLLTSPLSQIDFAARLAFFAIAPFAIVFAAALFPVTGTIVNVAAAILVFLGAEAIRTRSGRRPWLRRLLSRELALAAYYRQRPPRPFAYYIAYPLLFPYWLSNADARREFLLFKGYTLWSLTILVGSVVVQYFVSWTPELGPSVYLPVVAVTLLIELMFVMAVLMPMATTIIHLHQSMRRRRLFVLLLVALLSTGAAFARVARRRDPIVSYMTRERVLLRTKSSPKAARDAQLAALHAAWERFREVSAAPEGDGKVEGDPLESAHQALARFYKNDEALAFDLWASPRKRPQILVLYFEARRRRAPIWTALKRSGEELKDPNQLPPGAFLAMRAAAN